MMDDRTSSSHHTESGRLPRRWPVASAGKRALGPTTIGGRGETMATKQQRMMVWTSLSVALVASTGCSSDGSASTAGGTDTSVLEDVAPPRITLTARLRVKDQAATKPGVATRRSSLSGGDPLPGYQLYCVTFATPPTAVAAAANADGLVQLDFGTTDVSFGCFVLDAGGDSVATLVFEAGQERGQILKLDGSSNLGDVGVDLDNGIAIAKVGEGELQGSASLPCPLGEWVVQVPRADCDGIATATVWYVRDQAGLLRASFTIGPITLSGTDGVCGFHSEVDLPVSEVGDVYEFTYQHDPIGCPDRMQSVAATPSGACDGLAISTEWGPCVACEPGLCGCNEGTETCGGSYSAVRK